MDFNANVAFKKRMLKILSKELCTVPVDKVYEILQFICKVVNDEEKKQIIEAKGSKPSNSDDSEIESILCQIHTPVKGIHYTVRDRNLLKLVLSDEELGLDAVLKAKNAPNRRGLLKLNAEVKSGIKSKAERLDALKMDTYDLLSEDQKRLCTVSDFREKLEQVIGNQCVTDPTAFDFFKRSEYWIRRTMKDLKIRVIKDENKASKPTQQKPVRKDENRRKAVKRTTMLTGTVPKPSTSDMEFI